MTSSDNSQNSSKNETSLRNSNSSTGGSIQSQNTNPSVKGPTAVGLHEKIGREFVQRYESELNEKLLRKFTELIADAEIRGYANFSNNCQTVVSEIVDLFCKNFQVQIHPKKL